MEIWSVNQLGRDIQLMVRSLALLAGLVALSLVLFSFQSWLVARGGWALMIIGLLGLWSALLAAATTLLEQRRRRRERAIDAALGELRRAIGEVPKPARDEDERR